MRARGNRARPDPRPPTSAPGPAPPWSRRRAERRGRRRTCAAHPGQAAQVPFLLLRQHQQHRRARPPRKGRDRPGPGPEGAAPAAAGEAVAGPGEAWGWRDALLRSETATWGPAAGELPEDVAGRALQSLPRQRPAPPGGCCGTGAVFGSRKPATSRAVTRPRLPSGAVLPGTGAERPGLPPCPRCQPRRAESAGGRGRAGRRRGSPSRRLTAKERGGTTRKSAGTDRSPLPCQPHGRGSTALVRQEATSGRTGRVQLSDASSSWSGKRPAAPQRPACWRGASSAKRPLCSAAPPALSAQPGPALAPRRRKPAPRRPAAVSE